MTENKKTSPEIAENKPMTDEQLEEVAGGLSNEELMEYRKRSIGIRRCAANPEHLYMASWGACPHCGCKESTPALG